MDRIVIAAIVAAMMVITGCTCKKQAPGCGCGNCPPPNMEQAAEKPFKYFSRGYQRTFSDLNEKHLEAAQKNGINPAKLPENLSKARNLIEVKSCNRYKVDDLTHSKPCLVKKAATLLDDIGKNFQDSLIERGMSRYAIITTSILRTDENVKNLRKRNVNASENSAHLYGTTFDISYTRFEKMCKSDEPEDRLKSILAEVMYDLRKEGRCYVRYEVKQGCFHVTVIK